MQVRQELAEASVPAQDSAHRDLRGQQQPSTASLAAVRQAARDVLAALRSLAKLALRSSASMQAAATSLDSASKAPAAQVCEQVVFQALHAC